MTLNDLLPKSRTATADDMPAPYAVGDRVRAYSIGYGRTFPGVVTERTKGGAFVRTEGRPDGDGPTFYATPNLRPEW